MAKNNLKSNWNVVEANSTFKPGGKGLNRSYSKAKIEQLQALGLYAGSRAERAEGRKRKPRRINPFAKTSSGRTMQTKEEKIATLEAKIAQMKAKA
tara:strand:- start:255 stop:542 length:288 start_codon:yes stop_codon:yes gene_type:complete